VRRAIDRPKKNRIKVNDEAKNPHLLSRDLPTVKCTNCEKMNHNKRICGAERVIPKGRNKVVIELLFLSCISILSCIFVLYLCCARMFLREAKDGEKVWWYTRNIWC
jgi:hypothetical protein